MYPLVASHALRLGAKQEIVGTTDNDSDGAQSSLPNVDLDTGEIEDPEGLSDDLRVVALDGEVG